MLDSKKEMTMFYTFSQNNSGGVFDYDPDRGICEYVIVEADSVKDAVRRAEDIGLYFNGVDEGLDCECCGDRWYEPYNDDGTEFPEVYGRNVLTEGTRKSFEGSEFSTSIHYKDGTMKLVEGTLSLW